MKVFSLPISMKKDKTNDEWAGRGNVGAREINKKNQTKPEQYDSKVESGISASAHTHTQIFLAK